MPPPRRGFSWLIIMVASACEVAAHPSTATGATPLQTCTAQTIQGFPVAGSVCGGSTHALNCTAGAIYRCRSGPRFQQNNCSLSQACAVGCLTGPTTGTLADGCFAGPRPLVLSTGNTLGGNDVTLTVTLAASHPSGAIVNLQVDRGDLVPGSYCAVPDLVAGATSVSFALPTAMVGSPTSVNVFVDIAYSDVSGTSRQLVSVPSTLALDPGGTEPPAPPLASFTLTPSTIGPGQYSSMDVVLSRMAPARGVNISVSSSDPSVASVLPNAQPFVFGGCTTGGGSLTIQAARSVPRQTTVTVAASSGAPGQAPLTSPLTVTTGCTPVSCVDAGAGTSGGRCGALPDGCGGTISCGCNFGGQTCGGGGSPGVCGTAPSLAVSGLSLNPSAVVGGSVSTATVTLNMAAPPGGAAAFLSSSGAAASVPQSVVVPQGHTSASFTVSTSAVTATTFVTISAALGGSTSAVLTVSPGSACTPTTCAAQGKNCGSLANGCGGTLACGSCTAPQTCGGGGVANVCGTGTGCGAGTSQVALMVNGQAGSVASNPSGLTVSSGQTASACFTNNQRVEFRATRAANWSGAACDGGNTNNDTCRINLGTAAVSLTATLL